jgi:hypothetical protein
MSHNSVKVDTQEPNRAGEITQSLNVNDLSDVSAASPSDGQALIYSSGTWSSGTAGSSSDIQYIFYGRGETEHYEYSPATSLGTGAVLYVYDTDGQNTITGATVSTTATTGTGGGDWLGSVTLPAGTYRIVLTCLPTFTTTGYCAFSMENSSGVFQTSVGIVGETTTSTYGSGGSIATSIVEFTSSTTLNPTIAAQSGMDSIADQDGNITSSTSLLIEKLA